MKKYSFIIALLALGGTSCSDKWLEPEALSFYEPDITFSTQEGLDAALTACANQMRHYYLSDPGPALATELYFSDVAVSALTDVSGSQDISSQVTPTSNNNWFGSNMIEWFWQSGTSGISYANSVISRIPDIDMDSTIKDEMLSRAYFQRAWRYYHLIFQFGDVPLLTKEVSSPKLDFQATKIEVTIEKMISDLEFAVEHIAEKSDWGKENKGACQMLLIKYYLSAGEFEKAISMANDLIDGSGYQLMEESFGTFEDPFPDVHPIARNVIWDLHRPINKSIAANKESIMTLVDRYDDADSRLDTRTLNNFVPFWSIADKNRGILTPSKLNLGMDVRAGTNELLSQYPDYIDYREILGVGGGTFSRPTYFAETGMWTDENDLRHSREIGNWYAMEDMLYNNPSLLGTEDELYYHQPLRKWSDDGTLLCRDTIRCWFGYPYYKLWMEDPNRSVANGYAGVEYIGGPGDWYLYRLAEAYLLRAEAYYWTGNYALAADDVNKIRERAKCTTLFNAGDFSGIKGLDIIMDERARELMYEEFRHVELVRASYIQANLDGTYQSPASLADENSNSYWWHRITIYNNYYNHGIQTLHNDEYKISKHNIFWPVTQNNIDANLYGRINQNYGYAGYENNEEPIDSLEELELLGQ